MILWSFSSKQIAERHVNQRMYLQGIYSWILSQITVAGIEFIEREATASVKLPEVKIKRLDKLQKLKDDPAGLLQMIDYYFNKTGATSQVTVFTEMDAIIALLTHEPGASDELAKIKDDFLALKDRQERVTTDLRLNDKSEAVLFMITLQRSPKFAKCIEVWKSPESYTLSNEEDNLSLSWVMQSCLPGWIDSRAFRVY